MNSKQGTSYILQFFILLALIAFALLASGFVGIIIWKLMAGGNLADMQKDMMNPANATAVKAVQLVSSMVMFLLPAVGFALIINRRPLRYLGLQTKFTLLQAGIILAIVFVGFYLSGALAELTNRIPISAKAEKIFRGWEKSYTDQVLVIAKMKNIGDYLFTLIVVALAPAIFEEALFRGTVQQVLQKGTRSPWVPILVTSIIFSAVHVSHYGFLSRMGLGIILGLLFYYSKSLWLCILAHFLNNGFAVTAMYVMSKKGKLNADSMDERFPIWYGAVALVIIIMLFIAYKNESKRAGTYYVDNTETPEYA